MVEQGTPNPDYGRLLREDVELLAGRYKLDISDVLIDARLVERWEAPAAELLEELTRRHGWPPEMAGQFVTDVQEALLRGG